MTEWISIYDQLPPNDDTLVYEYDGIYEPRKNYGSITFQHIQDDKINLGYSRVRYWAYGDMDMPEEPVETTEEETKETSDNSVSEEGDTSLDKWFSNILGNREENSTEEDTEESEYVSPWFQTKKKWTSQNGKWTIQWTGDRKGNLIDNKTSKIYLWSYEDGEVSVIGTKIPKYIEKVIKESII